MKTRNCFVAILLGLFAMTAATNLSAGVDRPGPSSIKHYSKLNLEGLLSKDKAEDATQEAAPTAEVEAEEDQGEDHGHSAEAHAATEPAKATGALYIAVIVPTAGNETAGVVYFQSVEEGMKVWGTIEGLTPGDHGFHIHQYGDLSAANGTSAGGHFNPESQPHAGRTDAHRHVGDMGNITADEDGVAEFSFVDSELAATGPTSILGRGLIVHADADDLSSQPTGNAGPRVGMAVIGVANPKDQ